jgi:tetratricopeptide (TPR) repeat protein
MPDHPEVGLSLINLGQVLHGLADLDRARQHLERALAIYRAIEGADQMVGVALFYLGQVLRDLGDLDGAREYMERALAIYNSILGPDHPHT